VCYSVLQCVAVCCSVLQCVAVRCSVLQCVAVCCSVLQCVEVYGSQGYPEESCQCFAECCSVLQCVAACYSVLQCVAACCRMLTCMVHRDTLRRAVSVLQCAEEYYRVLQCITACCSVSQFVDVYGSQGYPEESSQCERKSRAKTLAWLRLWYFGSMALRRVGWVLVVGLRGSSLTGTMSYTEHTGTLQQAAKDCNTLQHTATHCMVQRCDGWVLVVKSGWCWFGLVCATSD